MRQALLDWITDLVAEYEFDGLRVDTAPMVKKPFWLEFQTAAGVFAMGEVFDGRVDFVSGFQNQVSAVMVLVLVTGSAGFG